MWHRQASAWTPARHGLWWHAISNWVKRQHKIIPISISYCITIFQRELISFIQRPISIQHFMTFCPFLSMTLSFVSIKGQPFIASSILSNILSPLSTLTQFSIYSFHIPIYQTKTSTSGAGPSISSSGGHLSHWGFNPSRDPLCVLSCSFFFFPFFSYC